MDSKERFGLLSAQAGVSFANPGLHCFKIHAASRVTGHVFLLGRTGISCLGLIQPRWAERKSAQASAALIFVRGLVTGPLFSSGPDQNQFWAEIS
jgi:hypothetical protein